jgi:hypothetical protein
MYNFNSYRKPLNKFQTIKRNKVVHIEQLKNDAEKKRIEEEYRVNEMNRETELNKINQEKLEIQRQIQEEKDNVNKQNERLSYIQKTYTAEVLKQKVDDFYQKLNTFDKNYHKEVIEQHFKTEYDELIEAYEIIKTSENEQELKKKLMTII